MRERAVPRDRRRRCAAEQRRDRGGWRLAGPWRDPRHPGGTRRRRHVAAHRGEDLDDLAAGPDPRLRDGPRRQRSTRSAGSWSSLDDPGCRAPPRFRGPGHARLRVWPARSSRARPASRVGSSPVRAGPPRKRGSASRSRPSTSGSARGHGTTSRAGPWTAGPGTGPRPSPRSRACSSGSAGWTPSSERPGSSSSTSPAAGTRPGTPPTSPLPSSSPPGPRWTPRTRRSGSPAARASSPVAWNAPSATPGPASSIRRSRTSPCQAFARAVLERVGER